MKVEKILEKEEIEKVKNVLVSRKLVEWVAFNYTISEHAEFRIVQRDYLLDRDFKTSIRKSPLAWKCKKENTIAIALDLYNYIIVYLDKENNVPIILTFATTKDKGTTVVEKFFVDYKDYMKGDK